MGPRLGTVKDGALSCGIFGIADSNLLPAAAASPAPASAHCRCNGRDALREAAAAPQVVSNRKHEEGRHTERGRQMELEQPDLETLA